jgi:hypothetical protein
MEICRDARGKAELFMRNSGLRKEAGHAILQIQRGESNAQINLLIPNKNGIKTGTRL